MSRKPRFQVPDNLVAMPEVPEGFERKKPSAKKTTPSVRVAVHIPADVNRAARIRCAELGLKNLSAGVTQALTAWLASPAEK